MTKRKVFKNIIRILLITCAIITIMEVVVYGAGDSMKIDTGITESIIGMDDGYLDVVKNVIGVVKYICYGASVIIALIIGVRFMTAAPEGKAEIKKQSIYMAVGAALLFATGAFVSIVQAVGAATIKNAA